MLLRHPLVTHKTTLMIHWHALRLWLRGARFHRHREVDPMTASPRPSGRRPAVVGPLLERLAWRVGLAAADADPVGGLTVVLPDGPPVFGDEAAARSRAEIQIHDCAGARPDARRWRDRRRRGVHGRPVVQPGPRGPAPAGGAQPRGARALGRLVPRPGAASPDAGPSVRRNTRAGSRRNIAAHYDLGNDFYRLFLDETMTYSSAVFATPDQSLADAQRNKYRAIAASAGLERGQHVLEIGTRLGRLRAVRGRRARAAA